MSVTPSNIIVIIIIIIIIINKHIKIFLNTFKTSLKSARRRIAGPIMLQ